MPKLSIIVPVYNEEAGLAELVRSFMACRLQCESEWIFVDDCSSDRSLELLRGLASEHRFKLLTLDRHLGKGAAIVRGLSEATGDFILIQDADSEYDPGDIPVVIQPLLDGRADVVYGSRFKNSQQVHRTYHYFVNQFLTALSNLLSGIYLTDMETCYKAYRAEIIKAMRLRSRRFGIEIELTAYIAKIRVRVFEVPISYFPRGRLQGKKINWKDGVAALFHLLRFNIFTSASDAFTSIPDSFLNRPL